MALERITFRPGINRQVTPTLNEGGWSDGSLVRFRDGLPEPIGGWVRAIAGVFAGIGRALHAWVALDGTKLVALGTSSKLYVVSGDTLNDITPAGLVAGYADVPFGVGWGAGAFGAGTFGTTRAGTVTAGTLRLWSLDHWGEELVALPRGGGIYNWKPALGLGTPAAFIVGAPSKAACLLTGIPERHLIAFGADTGGVQDPLLVRWSDVEDYTNWVPSATNSAGSYRLVGGSEIKAARPAPQEILIWTDSVLYAMRFQSLPYVYGFFQQGESCGLIAPGAAAVLNGVAYWMGVRGFFRYAGQVQPIDCTVRDALFLNFNASQKDKVTVAQNSGFNEIAWHYPSAGSLENDRYVCLNVVSGVWSLGMLPRTAWVDAGVFNTPMACAPDGRLYRHEFGTDADGAPLPAFVESGFFDIAAGQDFTFVDQAIPDFADHFGTVGLTIKAKSWPNGAAVRKGRFNLTGITRFISPRIRGRQISIRLETVGTATFWRLGALRLRLSVDGRK